MKSLFTAIEWLLWALACAFPLYLGSCGALLLLNADWKDIPSPASISALAIGGLLWLMCLIFLRKGQARKAMNLPWVRLAVSGWAILVLMSFLDGLRLVTLVSHADTKTVAAQTESTGYKDSLKGERERLAEMVKARNTLQDEVFIADNDGDTSNDKTVVKPGKEKLKVMDKEIAEEQAKIDEKERAAIEKTVTVAVADHSRDSMLKLADWLGDSKREFPLMLYICGVIASFFLEYAIAYCGETIGGWRAAPKAGKEENTNDPLPEQVFPPKESTPEYPVEVTAGCFMNTQEPELIDTPFYGAPEPEITETHLGDGQEAGSEVPEEAPTLVAASSMLQDQETAMASGTITDGERVEGLRQDPEGTWHWRRGSQYHCLGNEKAIAVVEARKLNAEYDRGTSAQPTRFIPRKSAFRPPYKPNTHPNGHGRPAQRESRRGDMNPTR